MPSLSEATEAAERACAGLRKDLHDAICASSDLQSMCDADYCRRFAEINEDLDWSGGVNWRTVALHLGHRVDQRRLPAASRDEARGAWMDMLGMRALARHLQRDIVIVSRMQGVTMHFKDAGPHRCGNGTPLATNKVPDVQFAYCLPRQAFSPDCIVVCHDIDHFWCTAPKPEGGLHEWSERLVSRSFKTVVDVHAVDPSTEFASTMVTIV
jgi:hypothetical protein